MKFLSRVVWSEGMHLAPQHFQTQSRYFEDSLWFLNSNLHSAPWGFLHLALDQEAVRNGEAILSHASGILPDGLIFDVPDSDPAPTAARLGEMFTAIQSEITLHLAIAQRLDQGRSYGEAESGSLRYSAVERELRDDTQGMGECNVPLARKNFRLVSAADVTEEEVSLPVARIARDGRGGFACDPSFIPPTLRIGASEALLTLLLHLESALSEKIAATRSNRLGSGRFELGTSALDVQNYWFLHALCSAIPALRHHLQERRSHPESVYGDLCQLAGALSTFSLESSLDEIPSYQHQDLSSTFRQLDALIRRSLEVVAPSNSAALSFKQIDSCIWTAEIKDERCFRRSRWILGIRSPMQESVLLRQAPRLLKVCSAEGVVKLVERALPGMELQHLQVPPAALHAQADMHYFSIAQTGPCWQHILQTRQVGVYVPGDLEGAVFELTVLLETSA